jgi:hypothetical protein
VSKLVVVSRLTHGSRRFFQLFERYNGPKHGHLKLKHPGQLQVDVTEDHRQLIDARVRLGSIGHNTDTIERTGRETDYGRPMNGSMIECFPSEISRLSGNQRQTDAIEASLRTVRTLFWHQSKDSAEIFAERSAEKDQQ